MNPEASAVNSAPGDVPPARAYVVTRTRTITEQTYIEAPNQHAALALAYRSALPEWSELNFVCEYDSVTEDTARD